LPEQIESLRDFGVEVELQAGASRAYLVPEYSGQAERLELTYEHAATLRLLLDAFPGARLTGLRRLPPSARPPRKGASS
jgi:hypothetical protein